MFRVVKFNLFVYFVHQLLHMSIMKSIVSSKHPVDDVWSDLVISGCVLRFKQIVPLITLNHTEGNSAMIVLHYWLIRESNSFCRSNLSFIVVSKSLVMDIMYSGSNVSREFLYRSELAFKRSLTSSKIEYHRLCYISWVNMIVIRICLHIELLNSKNKIVELLHRNIQGWEIKSVIKKSHDGKQRILFRKLVDFSCIKEIGFQKFDNSQQFVIEVSFHWWRFDFDS